MKRVITQLINIIIFAGISLGACAQSFTVIPLGVRGGLDESNLSSYMVTATGSKNYICLDAGTLYSGIKIAVDNGALPGPIGSVLRTNIKGYFISHPHLDHVAGLIINSPEDSNKNIYGLQSCLNVLKDKYFSWQSWANFADQGETPRLKKYHYQAMEPGQEIPAENTPLSVQAFPLSHGAPYESAAFLVRSGGNYLLYLGDTGADTVEHQGKLRALWQTAAPLAAAGKLKAIFIEVSFPNEQPERLLFGHLTPRLLMQEMQTLATLSGKPNLPGLPIIITHRKPSGNQEPLIRQQLEAANPLHLKLVFPEQGKRLDF